MNRLLSRVRYVLVSLMFAGTMTATSLTPVFAATGDTPPGNNGTLKIHEEGTPDGTVNNDPKVCRFNVEGFFLDPSQSGYLVFDTQGNDAPVGTPAGPYDFGPTNADGYYASQYFDLDAGHYKATLYGKQLPSGVLKDIKAKSKVFKVDCAPVVTEVVPLAPSQSTPTCEVPSMLVMPTATTGVVWSPVGSTTLQPGQSVTYTATAAADYVIKANAQTSFTVTNNFDPQTCYEQDTPVTPAPVTFDDKCGLQNDKFTIPMTTGVDYQIGGVTKAAGTYNGNGTVTVTAVAQADYVLTGTTSWSHTFTNEDCNPPCGCDTPNEITAPEVKFRDKCGMDMDKFVIPSKTGVKYKVNGQVTAAGIYNAYDYDVNGTVTVTAHAKKGYVLEGQDEWSYTFTNKDCKVRADKPMFKDLCETRNDTYTIPSTEHVYYTVNGTPKDADTYPGTGTVTITAHADEGYKIKGKTSWTYTFTNESCGGGQGGDNPVTPAAVTFNDVCATANDTYTIPSTAGVVYKVGGNVVAAGTHSGTGTVTVMAEATSGHVLTGTATWTYDFTNVACPGGGGGGFVLGDTFTPTPVAAQPQVLADTGASSVTSTLVAIFVLVTALAVYAFNPKFEAR